VLKNVIGTLLLMLSMAATCFAGVTVKSPLPASTSGSPVHFVASASSSLPITAMRIYVDGVSVYLTASSALDVWVPVSSGTHMVVVQAWDSSGAVFQAPETVTVTGGLSVTSPANGASVASPMKVVATAAAALPISAMVVYLDGNNVFTTSGGNLNASISASAGQHSLIVQAWDTSGAVYKQALTVTVDSGIPANSITKSAIQAMTGWQDCSACAGANGNGSIAGFSMVQHQTLSLSGNSTQFNIWGSTPYSDVLWWKQLGADNSATNFKYDIDFYLTAPQLAQALEFDVNQSIGTTKFIFGTQCNIRSGGVWDVWDTAGKTWRSTGVPCPVPAANTWHHVTWEFQRNGSQATFIALTFDGVKHFINQTYNAQPSSVNELNVAFQMDGDYAQHAYSVWLDNVTLSYW
jgi:hypothetical protein